MFKGYLLFFKESAVAECLVVQVVNGGLDGTAAGFHRAGKILVGDASGAEHVSVGKVLRGNITDWQFGEDNLK